MVPAQSRGGGTDWCRRLALGAGAGGARDQQPDDRPGAGRGPSAAATPQSPRSAGPPCRGPDVHPFAEDWLANQPRLEPLQYEFLTHALKFYEEFAREEGDNADVHREVAAAQRRVGEIQYRFAHYPEAELALRRSIEIMGDVVRAGRSQPNDCMQWVECQLALGRLLKRSGKPAGGDTAFRHTVLYCRGLVAEARSLPR